MRGVALVLVLTAASAQSAEAPPDPVPLPAAEPASQADPWQVSLSVFGFMLMGQTGFLSPVVFVDKGSIHLEARYNREDFDTASFLFGWTFHFGDEQRFVRLLPTLAVAVGNSNGLVPGIAMAAAAGRFSALFEVEYFFHFTDPTFNFFNLWSELNINVVSWLSVGASVQHMQLAHSDRLLDWGPMVGIDVGGFSLSFYFYGLWTAERWATLVLRVPFF